MAELAIATWRPCRVVSPRSRGSKTKDRQPAALGPVAPCSVLEVEDARRSFLELVGRAAVGLCGGVQQVLKSGASRALGWQRTVRESIDCTQQSLRLTAESDGAFWLSHSYCIQALFYTLGVE